MGRIRAGQRYGEWKIVGEEPLGAGGNGQVWRVEGSDSQLKAIKILSGRGMYRLDRFRDEVAFLITHPDTTGILPLLDYHISNEPGETSWYVMPMATPIRQALGSDPNPTW